VALSIATTITTVAATHHHLAHRRWQILDSDFTSLPDGGELTPTLKLKRNVVHSKYGSVIKELYGKDFVPVPWAPSSSM
jgi:long-chain acyl-CoA synthetase